MAVEFFTGFGGCGVTADTLAFFDAGAGAYSATGGYGNGKCFVPTWNERWQKDVSAGLTKCVGFHVKNTGQGSYSTAWAQIFLSLTVGAAYIRVFNTSAGIKVYNDAALLGTIGSGVVIPATLSHVEIKVFSNATTGTVEVKLDGVSVGSLTNVNTTGTNITAVAQGNSNDGNFLVDNIYIADDFQGEMYEIILSPTSDSSVQFTPSAGSNFENVDDAAQDGDTTNNQSSTVGHKDLFGYGDMATSGLTVKVVSLVTVAKKDDAGARTLTPIIKQDATEYDQATVTLTTAYPASVGAGSINTLSAAPDTSAWTPTIVNALLAGYKVEA